MNRLEKLGTGKYKNIEFLCAAEQIQSLGAKTIIHDYPNTGARYVEFQGQVPNDFSLEITFAGLDFQEKFKRFKQLMEEGTPGKLYMPVFGLINNVIALSSPASADTTTIGQITMTVAFSVTIDKPAPTQSAVTEEDISDLKGTSLSDLKDKVKKNYIIPVGQSNISTIANDIVKMVTVISIAVGDDSMKTRIERNISKAVRNAENMSNLLLGENGVLSGQDADYNKYLSLKNTGNNLPIVMYEVRNDITTPFQNASITWANNSVERQQRNKNRLTMVNTMKIYALISMCYAACKKEYTTIDDVNTVVNDIMTIYNDLVLNNNYCQIVLDMQSTIDKIVNQTIGFLK